MYKVAIERQNSIGILDTTDGVTENYTRLELYDIITEYKIEIEGCFCFKESGLICVKTYKSQDVLFKGDTYKLIIDTESEIVHVVVGSISYIGFWISGRGKLKCKYTLRGLIEIKDSETKINPRLVVYACRKAKEIDDSLFINFECDCMLEVYKYNGVIDAVIVE